MNHRFLSVGFVFVSAAFVASAQQSPPADPRQPVVAPGSDNNVTSPSSQPSDEESKRLFGIIPNYRTSPSLQNYEPLTSAEKFKLASQDSFDRGTVILAALFGGEAQLTNANRSFGQGVAGYAQYWGASYGDFVIGDFMTEGLFPTMLHQDPRYFRRGTGGAWSRLGYAMGQIFWTHTDAGGTQFNYSEVVGNSVAVAISNAYYVNNRTAHDAVAKLGMQLGVDMASNVLKEFWPEIHRKLTPKHNPDK